MTLTFRLQSPLSRFTLLSGTIVFGGLFMWWTVHSFILEAITDPRLNISRETLMAAAQYFPNSGQVQGRLAARMIESPVSEEEDEEQMLVEAEKVVTRAAVLLPWNYENYLLLASVREQQENFAGAEQAIQSALRLAPHNVEVHWRAGNFYLRAEKLSQATLELRQVALTEPARLPQILELLWNATENNISAIQEFTQNTPVLQFDAVPFLLMKGQVNEAVRLYSQIDLSARIDAPQSPSFINTLIAEKRIVEAHKLWLDLMGKTPQSDLLWNGGFEKQPPEVLNQFDWKLMSNKYAQIGISNDRAHNGRQSLKLIFNGEDTTRLTDNIQQVVVVKPGAKYRLECYALTSDLISSEPVHLVVKGFHPPAVIGTSPTIKADGESWQLIRLEFTASRDMNAVVIEIQRVPRFSYDTPTTGTIWFDDISLKEQ